jgi:hypothetical protein
MAGTPEIERFSAFGFVKSNLERIAEGSMSVQGSVMTVEHMVWFRFREDVPVARREALAAELRALMGVVPQVSRIEAGMNFTDRARGCQLGLLVTLESKAALDSYQVHPAHVMVAKQLRAECDEILAFDFEHP